MDTILIVVIAAIGLLLLFFVGRRTWARGQEARREKAGELRVEATRGRERARRAESQAERERERAEARAARAERIDPDTATPGRRFRSFSRDQEEDVDSERRSAGADRDEEGARPEEGNGRRRSLWDRIAHR